MFHAGDKKSQNHEYDIHVSVISYHQQFRRGVNITFKVWCSFVA